MVKAYLFLYTCTNILVCDSSKKKNRSMPGKGTSKKVRRFPFKFHKR